MAYKKPAALWFLGLAVALGTCCTGSAEPTDADDSVAAPALTTEWPIESPEAHGLDPRGLATLVEAIRTGTFPNLHSLLIVKDGVLVLEEYFGGYGPDDLHTLQSVSKSVSSAIAGIALEWGVIRSLDETVLGFLDDLEGIENVDARKRAMTIRDLLTMRSGTDYTEGFAGSPHSQLNSMSRGWTRFILSRPMVHAPGTRFNYDSGAVILLSGLMHARTGEHADLFAAEHLFEPLGIERSEWSKNREGHPHLGGGLDLRPRDMAKFGLLWLRGGKWNGRQVVPASWVRESTRRHVVFDRPRGRAIGYGYWWWVLPPDPQGAGKQDIWGAFGFRAQYIFCVPEHDMVVVVTGGARGWPQERNPRDFLYTHILPAVRR